MNEHPGAPGAPSAGDDYSATVLASHWIQRPDSPDTTRISDPSASDTAAPEGSRARHGAAEATALDTAPDRVEGTLLRFGPGVNADTVRRSAAAAPAPAPVRRRTWRRHALPAMVLLAVLAYLFWHGSEPSVGVDGVTIAATPASPGCGETADVTATVTTDGRAGELAYRWVRGDGTSSKTLYEEVTRGQKRARLHLLWTFQGEGRYAARAELRLLSPVRHTAGARLTYHCP
ncbi:hypothetical protein AB0912_33290 [Streptomyces sp. NPDC007084]|uniref:hypothetical protein n=1 Tax=Streptomyces sp. NPDC007084 TaxID=3154313 RepID=UPI0034539E9B